ncbi:ImmA/IrrE family metallo-endopeptidase [Metaclostridioides mangenotii]|uniref:ImmA/IrrE family metallo-endopeptidase n=1 Tax=Metaclostridioides mangenotii TaxID=1540 RepID=UPI00068F8EF7|nr:ImmA/IrrE family metallo-endopeptidase [Clostridioides mangenotii]
MRDNKNLVRNFINIYKTNNVHEICSQLNIKVYKSNLKDIKGYFLNISEGISIVVDYNLNEHEERCVIAHELGHVMLHRSSNICYLKNYTYSNTNKLENEANEFAAELLITDEDIKEAIEKQFSKEQMGCYFEVPLELVEYKFK